MPASRKRIRDMEDTIVELAQNFIVEGGRVKRQPLRGSLRAAPLQDDARRAILSAVEKLSEAIDAVYKPALRAPRLRRLYQRELPATTVWSHFRRERNDVAFMRHYARTRRPCT